MPQLQALPQDIVLIVLRYLEAPDLLCLQLTSHACQNSFSEPIYLRTVLRQYTHSRELRKLPPETLNDEIVLRDVFRNIATRYHHLGKGQARTIQRLNLRCLDQSGQWQATPQWDYHESQPGGRLYHETAGSHLRGIGWKPYLFRPTLWSYDDGIIAYIPTIPTHDDGRAQAGTVFSKDTAGRTGLNNNGEDDLAIEILDLNNGNVGIVPFELHGKIIRTLKLKERTLIVEWAEKEPFHDLNMVDKVHRHFSTCFGVSDDEQLEVTFRSEWRIHFLGFPLTSRDYFFSTHTSRHYALYYWQPNRSLWTGDEDQPIEALFVWDIAESSSYRPSEDPSNTRGRILSREGKRTGPVCVARYSMRELEWLGIRQHASIGLTKFELDSDGQILTWYENKFSNQYGYFDPAERSWESTTTSFPFVGEGPVLRRSSDVELPSYRGHCTMESDEIKAEIESWFLPVSEIGDRYSHVRFALIETCFTGLVVENRLLARLQVKQDEQWQNLDDELSEEISAMGRIAGDERWLIGQNKRMQIVIARFQ